MVDAHALTPLWRRLGARFEDFDGAPRVLDFGDADRESGHVRTGCGLFEDIGRRRFVVTGKDRLKYIHGQVTNDVKGLGPDRGCRAAQLMPNGKMVGEVIIRNAGDRLVLTLEVGCADGVVDRLSRYVIMDDCSIDSRASDTTVLLLIGPAAGPLLAEITGDSVRSLATHSGTEIRLFGEPAGIVATDHFGTGAFELHVATTTAESAATKLLSRDDVHPAGSLAIDAARIEAGRPRHGREIDADTLPPEIGMEDAISYTKGCYVGQEVIARIKTYGQAARRMVGLLSDEVLLPGTALTSDAGVEVGKITSAVVSPALRRPIALAIVRRSAADPGTVLHAVFEKRRIAARVVPLPFVPSVGE